MFNFGKLMPPIQIKLNCENVCQSLTRVYGTNHRLMTSSGLTFYAYCIFSKTLTDTAGVIGRAIENALESFFFTAFGTDIP